MKLKELSGTIMALDQEVEFRIDQKGVVTIAFPSPTEAFAWVEYVDQDYPLPSSPSQEASEESKLAPTIAAVAAMVGATVGAPLAPTPAPAPAPAQPETPATAGPAAEGEKRKPGRPKGSTNKPKEAAPAPAPAPATAPAPADPPPTVATKASPPATYGRTTKSIKVGAVSFPVEITSNENGWLVSCAQVPEARASGTSEVEALDTIRENLAQWMIQTQEAAEKRVAELRSASHAEPEAQVPIPAPAQIPPKPSSSLHKDPESAAAAIDLEEVDTLADLPPNIASYEKIGEAIGAVVNWFFQQNPDLTHPDRTREEVVAPCADYLSRVWERIPAAFNKKLRDNRRLEFATIYTEQYYRANYKYWFKGEEPKDPFDSYDPNAKRA